MTSQLIFEIFRDFSNKCHRTAIKYTQAQITVRFFKESKSTKSPVYPVQIFILISYVMKFKCPTVNVLIRMTSCTLRVIIFYFKLKTSYFFHQKLACTPEQKALTHSLQQNLYSAGGLTTHWMLLTHLRPTLVSPAKHE